MTFDEAVATPGTFLVSADEVMNGNRVVAMYRLGSAGAHQLAYLPVPEAEYAAFVADLVARGVPVAESDHHGFVWVRTADGIAVYDLRCKTFEAAGDRATLSTGRIVAAADIARVIAFAESDMVYRGVKAILHSGESVDLVTNVSMTAMTGMMYSRNELLAETGWTATVGSAIATWAGAPFENQILG